MKVITIVASIPHFFIFTVMKVVRIVFVNYVL
jgi:hypothetical protein